MKKTLVALAVTAFAASASAVTLYEQDGSKVDFDGSIRILLEQKSSKTKPNGATTKQKNAHTNLHNDGSRFGVRLKHNIAEDFYALGRLEFRFSRNVDTTDQFGDLYAHRAYVGLGSKKFGELTFGRQLVIGDDIAQSGFDYAYGVWDTTLTTSGKSVVRYDYRGVEGLHLSADYRFAEERDGSGEVLDKKVKSGYDVGAVYNFDVAKGQSVTVSAGYSRNNYKTTSSAKHHSDAWALGAKYEVNALTLAADYSGAFDKDGASKDRVNGFRLGAKYQITDKNSVYTNYGYAVEKDKTGNTTTAKTVYNRFMLGTDYKLHKQVLTYVEGSVAKAKKTTYASNAVAKTTDKAIGVGLRVFW